MKRMCQNVADTFEPKFVLGMLFSSKDEFRVAIHSQAVNTRRDIKITKNDNLCESFNSNLLEAREKQIYTMLEMIREFIMSRLQQKRDKARRRWHGKVCPKIKKILHRHLDKASSDCIPIKASDVHFEISCFDGSICSVDLEKRS